MGQTLVRAERDAIGFDYPVPSGGRVYARMVLEGTQLDASVEGLDPSESRFSFYSGQEPQAWVTGLRGYEVVRYRELIPGLELEVRLGAQGVSYEMVASAEGAADALLVRWEGLQELETAGEATPASGGSNSIGQEGLGLRGELRRAGPPTDGDRRWQLDLAGGPRLPGQGASSSSAIVDPDLAWSTYLGGGGWPDYAYSTDLDAIQDVHVGGGAGGLDFPKTPGAFQSQPSGPIAWAFVTRLRAEDSTLVFSSVLGGLGTSYSWDVAAFPDGRTAVAGRTHEDGFPLTPGAFDTVWLPSLDTKPVGVVFELSSQGDQLIFSTYLKGTTGSYPQGVAVDPDTGSVIVCGQAFDPGFPTTPGAFQTNYHKPAVGYYLPFITRINPAGTALEWSTFLGGSVNNEYAYDIVRQPDGVLTICGAASSPNFPITPGAYQMNKAPGGGYTGFITRMNAQGSGLIWSTFLGGDFVTHLAGLDVDPSGAVAVGGYTNGIHFPTTRNVPHPRAAPNPPGLQLYHGVLARLNNTGTALIYSTYLHGDLPVMGGAGGRVQVDASGVATITGGGPLTPMTPGSFQPTTIHGSESFLVRASPTGDRFFYSTYFGGTGTDEPWSAAAFPDGSMALCGSTTSLDFPVTPNASQPTYGGGDRDAFVTRLNLLLDGVTRLGASSPECNGPLVAAVTRRPTAGDMRFGFYCSAAPAVQPGWLIVGQPSSTGTNVGGATLWIDLDLPHVVLPALANEQGYVEVDHPLGAATPGQTFAVQFVFPTSGLCPTPARRATSNALVVVVQ
jgi:hypothetical protein